MIYDSFWVKIARCLCDYSWSAVKRWEKWIHLVIDDSNSRHWFPPSTSRFVFCFCSCFFICFMNWLGYFSSLFCELGRPQSYSSECIALSMCSHPGMGVVLAGSSLTLSFLHLCYTVRIIWCYAQHIKLS